MLQSRGVQRQHVSRPTSNLRVQGLKVPTRNRSRYAKATCPIQRLSAHSGLNCRTGGEPHLFGQFAATCPTSLHWIGGMSPPSCPPASGFGFSKPGRMELPCFAGCFQLHPLPLQPHRLRHPHSFRAHADDLSSIALLTTLLRISIHGALSE
jgi:hypothetical protein